MKKTLLTHLLLLSSIGSIFAQLDVASLMFVGYNGDGTDGVAFVALEDVPAGTTIYFTDNEWDGVAFETGESYWQWSSGATLIAGTVVTISEINQGTLSGSSLSPNATVGTATWSTTSAPDNNSDLDDMNEAVYMYLADTYNVPTLFITAIANNNFNPTTGELSGTGLTEGVNAIQLLGNNDVLVYDSPIECGSTIEECVLNLANPDNWVTDNGPGDNSNDGDVDFPDSLPESIILPMEVCPTTTGLTVSAITGSSATLSWDAMEGATGYVINFKCLTCTETKYGAVGAGTTSVNLGPGELSPGNDYGFSIRTKCEGMGAPWADLVFFSTPLRLAGEISDIALVYPNPNNGTFTVRLPDGVYSETVIRVYDLSGRLVMEHLVAINQLSNPAQLQMKEPGIYNIMIQSGNASWVEMIVVQ